MANSSVQNSSCEQAKVSTLNDLVLVTGDDGITYKKEHCAKCNGITNFKRWTVGVMLGSYCPIPPEVNWHNLGENIAYQFYKAGCTFQQFPVDVYQPRYCLRTGYLYTNYDLSGWQFASVTCNEKSNPIQNGIAAFGSLSCCIEKSPSPSLYPEDCSTTFTCYVSSEKQTWNNNSKEIGTNSMMIFFNFKSSNVSNIFFLCICVQKKSRSKNILKKRKV